MRKGVLRLIEDYKRVFFRKEYPILDIGGGDGVFLKSQGISNATIIDATSKKDMQYNYIYADLTKKLPKITKKFKTIFIMETLEHLPNPLYLLAQVYDILDKEGRVYISIPYTPIGKNLEHQCRWKLKEILSQTSKLGFVPKVLEARRRFKNTAFFLPHCWIVLELRKKNISPSIANIKNYELC